MKTLAEEIRNDLKILEALIPNQVSGVPLPTLILYYTPGQFISAERVKTIGAIGLYTGLINELLTFFGNVDQTYFEYAKKFDFRIPASCINQCSEYLQTMIDNLSSDKLLLMSNDRNLILIKEKYLEMKKYIDDVQVSLNIRIGEMNKIKRNLTAKKIATLKITNHIALQSVMLSYLKIFSNFLMMASKEIYVRG